MDAHGSIKLSELSLSKAVLGRLLPKHRNPPLRTDHSQELWCRRIATEARAILAYQLAWGHGDRGSSPPSSLGCTGLCAALGVMVLGSSWQMSNSFRFLSFSGEGHELLGSSFIPFRKPCPVGLG